MKADRIAERFVERYALLVLLVAVVVTFSLLPQTGPAYSQPDNYRNIVASQVVLAVLALGALVGAVNGLVVTRFGVNALITTLGSASVVIGVVNWYTGGVPIIQGIPTTLTNFGSGNWLGLPKMAYLLVAVALLIWYLLEHAPFGR